MAGAVGDDVRGDAAVAVEVELDLDAAELGRIEPDLEAVLAFEDFAGDRDGDAGERHRGGRRCERGGGMSPAAAARKLAAGALAFSNWVKSPLSLEAA